MVRQSIFSVVRLLAAGIISLAMLGCTAQHTREVSRDTLRGIGLATSISVTRTGQWSLPTGTYVYLAPVFVLGTESDAYPRLRNQLNEVLEALVTEWFQGGVWHTTATAPRGGLGSGVLVRVGLVRVSDKLSSLREISDNSGMSGEVSGHDQLVLVMKVFDVRSGQLLDTLVGESVSGWQWSEHRVKELSEPTLRAMLAKLAGRPSIAAVP